VVLQLKDFPRQCDAAFIDKMQGLRAYTLQPRTLSAVVVANTRPCGAFTCCFMRRSEAAALLTRAGEIFRRVLEVDGWSSRCVVLIKEQQQQQHLLRDVVNWTTSLCGCWVLLAAT
jgi:hypothetical protein